MTPAMEELVVNFLLRMTFLLGDGKDSRDREMVALLKHTQIMFSEALKLWPNVRLKWSRHMLISMTQGSRPYPYASSLLC